MRLARLLIVAGLLFATAQAGSTAYTVRKGDTLNAISAKVHVPVSVLAKANAIKNVDLISAGQVLQLPGATKGAPGRGMVMTGTRTHVVAAGENLAGIAARAGTSVTELVKLNGIRNADLVRAGTRLRLPGAQWLCPVRGHYTVVSNFAAPRPGNKSHEGNDIFADRGSSVVTPVSGTLRQVQGQIAGNAFYLAGDDGATYYFAHLDKYLRGAGPVAAGTVVGLVGNTGDARTTPPHLHFEIHPDNGVAADPFPTLRAHC